MRPSPRLVARLAERHWAEEHGVTLSRHARERMAEMGVTAEQVCEVVRLGSSWPQSSRTSRLKGRLHWLQDYPLWAVVTAEDEPGLVITVVFRSTEEYERDGSSFTVR